MTAQETNLLNAFETTLTGTIGASDLTITVNSVVDSASNTLTAPCYLVLNPDSATNREVVLVSSINVGTKTLTISAIGNRYLTGSAANSGLSHASGSVVRMSPLQQHIEDINDRVDTVINEAGTALNTTLFLDEDDMTSNSATKGVTQQSVKAYVDTQLTAEDLDISADSGSNIAIDLDSEVLDLEGGTGIDTATGTNKVTFNIDSTVATLTGSQALTNKTIDVDSNTVSNIEVDNLKSGVLDTDLSSTAGTDTTLPSAKAVKTYVDAQVTAQDLDLISDSGTIDIDLDSESLTVTGGEGIDTSATGTTLTIAGEDATTSNKGIASFSSDNFAVSSGAVTIKDSGVSNDELAGSIANAKLANSSITVTDGSSSTATALGGTITFSGTSNEVEVGESSGTITIGLPSSITVNVTGNVTGNVSGTSGSTTGNAATATALATARNIGGVSFNGTANIDLPGVNTAGSQNTSGTAAGLSATLAVASGGTNATSMTDKAVVITQDSGTDTLSSVAMDANGELLIGGTSGPAVGTLTAGTNVTITNSDGGISIAAAGGGGKILQVVTGTTTSDSGAIASTSFSDTGLSASITPSATSSKVLVLVTQTVQYTRNGGNEQVGYINIMRATTELGEYFYKGDEAGKYGPNQISLSFLDSPSSTSALTYKTQIKADTTSDSGSVRANQQTTGSESPSHIHLIEIGA
jgi:hypothetical protein